MSKLREDLSIGLLGAAAGLFSSSVMLLIDRIDTYYASLSPKPITEDQFCGTNFIRELWWIPLAFWHVLLSVSALGLGLMAVIGLLLTIFLVARRVPGAAQPLGQGADAGHGRPGGGQGAGHAAPAGQVEGDPGRLDGRDVERVGAEHRPGGVQGQRPQQPRVAGGEGLAEVAAVGVAVQVDRPGLQGREHVGQVAGGVGGAVQVAAVDEAAAALVRIAWALLVPVVVVAH